MTKCKQYPDECVAFEIIGLDEDHLTELKIGDHVEGAGSCCQGTEREWQHGVIVINGAVTVEDEYQSRMHLRALTPTAQAMLDQALYVVTP